MQRPAVAAGTVVSRATAVRRALRRMLPPRRLGRRIQWLFLLMGLFNVVGSLPRIFSSTEVPAAQRIAASLAALFLLVWWVHGYRKNRLGAWALPIEGLAIAAVGVGQHDYVATLGMLFSTVSYRGLFGSWRQVIGFVAAAYAGSVSAVMLTDSGHLGSFLVQSAGVPPLAIFTALVALSTRRQERASTRERIFSQVATTLATSPDREIIYRTATEAAHQMLGDRPGAWAAISVPDEQAAECGGQRIAMLVGPAPMHLAGSDIDLDRLPAEMTGGLLLPLATDKGTYGTLVVMGGRAELAEARNSLHALAGQTVLGLVNAEHAADLRHQAFHDALTGLANRALLHQNLERALARAQRGTPLAVLLMDLDGFKKVNDTHGHAAGDLLLVNVAQRLRDAVRGADTAARLGGDEFAVILDGMECGGDALVVAERILASVQAQLSWADADISPRASLGVAIWEGHASVDALLHDADTAMYAAKNAGKGCVAHFDGDGQPVVHDLPTAPAERT
jgi:diguanylate cyclase (GGDEF)-like protein